MYDAEGRHLLEILVFTFSTFSNILIILMKRVLSIWILMGHLYYLF